MSSPPFPTPDPELASFLDWLTGEVGRRNPAMSRENLALVLVAPTPAYPEAKAREIVESQLGVIYEAVADLAYRELYARAYLGTLALIWEKHGEVLEEVRRSAGDGAKVGFYWVFVNRQGESTAFPFASPEEDPDLTASELAIVVREGEGGARGGRGRGLLEFSEDQARLTESLAEEFLEGGRRGSTPSW